jgi:hypothetical protein
MRIVSQAGNSGCRLPRSNLFIPVALATKQAYEKDGNCELDGAKGQDCTVKILPPKFRVGLKRKSVANYLTPQSAKLLPKRAGAFWEGHKKSLTLFQKICWEEPKKQKT